MRYYEISEAPIGDIHTYGNMTHDGSLRPEDRRAITSQKHLDNVKRVLEKAPVLIDLHFVNLPYRIDDVGRHISLSGANQGVGYLQPEQFKRVYGFDVHINPQAVNIIYVENEGSNRMPFTPWMIAHRMAHAFDEAENQAGRNLTYHSSARIPTSMIHTSGYRELRSEFFEFLEAIPLKYKRGEFGHSALGLLTVVRAIGTTKALRDGYKLNGPGEIVPEMFAQFCVLGRIKLNPIPEVLDGARYDGNLRGVNNMLFEFVEQWQEMFTKLLKRAVGKIVVL